MMLSRIADSLFWLNRYMERADGLLRLLYTHYGLTLDTDIAGNITWKPVLEIFSASGADDMAALENDTEKVLHKTLIDNTNSNSLRMLINRARENARGIQDHITKEVWEEVNHLYHMANDPSIETRLQSEKGIETLKQFQRQSIVFTGTSEITMSRGTGWQFMNLGKLMERCWHTLALTQKQFELIEQAKTDSNDILQWRYLLLALSGYELYLKSYHTANHTQNVLHQVLLNEKFTRSVLYILDHIENCLHIVTAKNSDQESARLLRCFGKLHSKVKYMDLEHMDTQQIRTFLTEVKNELLQFNNQLGQYFFSYS